jgi:hypothetical protein
MALGAERLCSPTAGTRGALALQTAIGVLLGVEKLLDDEAGIYLLTRVSVRPRARARRLASGGSPVLSWTR